MNYDLNTNSEYLTDFEMSRDPLNEAPLDNSVTDNSGLGWKSKFVGNYNATFGFRFSDKLTTTISAHIILNKSGFGLSPSRDYPDINVELGENITRNSLNSDVESSRFNQFNVRFSQLVYVGQYLFMIGGVEYSYLSLEKGIGAPRVGGLFRSNQSNGTYNDNTLGMFAGLGYELPLSTKTSLMVTGIYSMSNYNGDKLYYQNLEFDIGGVELGYTLRYYLK